VRVRAVRSISQRAEARRVAKEGDKKRPFRGSEGREIQQSGELNAGYKNHDLVKSEYRKGRREESRESREKRALT